MFRQGPVLFLFEILTLSARTKSNLHQRTIILILDSYLSMYSYDLIIKLGKDPRKRGIGFVLVFHA